MELENRIEAFVKLGEFLRQFELSDSNVQETNRLNTKYFKRFESAIREVNHHNPWFIEKFVRQAITGISRSLEKARLQKWMEQYPELKNTPKKPISAGIVMAGNIPMVGFHDFLSVLISGNKFIGKLSSKDNILLPLIADILMEIYPAFQDSIQFTNQHISDCDVIIATGSANTARYFDYYFGNSPNIIRKNRNSVAILDGAETEQELQLLGDDIFRYFGLGCRSVSKLYVPAGYDFSLFFNAIEPFAFIINHPKYANNYKYNRSILLMNQIKHEDNGFVLLKEDESIASPVSVLHYQYYNKKELFNSHFEDNRDIIQCIVSGNSYFNAIPPGKAQNPEVWEYADNRDTIALLLSDLRKK
jgi:hypothetical protein